MKTFWLVTAAYGLTLLSTLLPPARAVGAVGVTGAHTATSVLEIAVVLLWTVYALRFWWRSRGAGAEGSGHDDAPLIFAAALLGWEVVTSRSGLLPAHLFPRPAQVAWAYTQDWQLLAKSAVSSLSLLLAGYGAAVLLAVPLGLVVGWRRRLFGAVYPIAKVMSPIPPTVYVPYAITLLPTFWSSSAFVIFAGSFWPVFMSTLNGVAHVDSRLVDSARCLGVKEGQLLRRVLLPAALPAVFGGAMIGLVTSFIMLTVAEMIGARSGLGWYIQYFADFASYDRVVAGIILVGSVVATVVWGFDSLKGRLTRWQTSAVHD